LWDTYNEDRAPSTDVGKIIRIAIFAALGIIIFAIVSNQSVNLLMNIAEFGDVFTKPLYYSTISGLVLASIALVRGNFVARHSITWYGIRTIINLLKRSEYDQPKMLRYSEFRMSPHSFGIWQVMKIVLFAPLFSNLLFGMAVDYIAKGNDIGIDSIGSVFAIPFADITMDGTFAQDNVFSMIPALTLLIPALLAAVSLRILLYVGVSGTVNIVSQYVLDAREGKPRFLSYISTIELIIGATVFWLGFNLFFSSNIDYNTRYAIAGTLALGAAFLVYSFLDRRRARVMIYPTKRHMYSRLLTIGVVVVLVGSVMAINHSIADTKKIEWRGPYTAQEIAVNRYMHDLESVEIVNYDVKPTSVTPSRIRSIVDDNRDTLNNIRLWDQEAASSKLRPELGQRNDIHYVDTDILRFGDTMYWTGTTTPNLPADVTVADRWFSEHITYTHANVGMKMLEADTGNVADEQRFFDQRRIYYGESDDSGLFDKVWSAYPVGRTESREVDQYFYNGTGGIDVAPPLSWMFEPNFMLSYPGTPIHVMRFKDVHERMELLYPYFVYDFAVTSSPNPQFRPIDIYPVTDGQESYWLMPLVAAFDTSHVPWSSEFMLKLAGYALINTYDGDVQVFATGDDYFSKMFLEEYSDIGVTGEIPGWLSEQIKYPEEMFIWTVSQFSVYHVTDPKTFIEAKQFYSIPEDGSRSIPPYYINTRPQGFETAEFVGFQSLELRNSQTKNLVGYMTVRNDLDSIGEMSFFSVPTNSSVKLLGPTGAKETLEKDTDFKSLRTLLNNPRLGENILYRIGDVEVYFIPVYTSNTGGGVVSQTGTIAAVGAASITGTYYVGLGDTPVQAFEDYLLKVSGVTPVDQPGSGGNQTVVLDKEAKILKLESVFSSANITVVKPTEISAPVEFREAEMTYIVESEFADVEARILEFVKSYAQQEAPSRVFEWEQERTVNFGFLSQQGGIVENHYISIEVG
jgi:uncharacterized membrane protein (UPF0182 family)